MNVDNHPHQTSRWAAFAVRFGERRRRRAACAGLVLLLACVPPWSARGTTQQTGTLTVTVTGARNAAGKIGIVVFTSREGFPEESSKGARAELASIDPSTLSATVTFRDLPIRSYAVAVLHDENENGRLDKNFLGIPREGYGASNNAAKKRRAPSFDDAQFSFQGERQTIEIKLVY